MRATQYISDKAFGIQTEDQTPIRRRNRSMGAKPQTERKPLPVLAQEYQPVTTYRKYRLHAKIQKFKSMKVNTKLCQESINNYNCLKKQVTSKKLDPEVVATPKREPKLSVNNLDMSCKKSFIDRSFKPLNIQRSKTEGHEHNGASCGRVNNDKSLRIRMKPKIHKENGYKKYNDLSINQKVQFQGQTNRYSMLVKLGQIVGRKNSTAIASRKASDDYSLQGWQSSQQYIQLQ